MTHYLDGRIELTGGSGADRKAAMEGPARFLPGVRSGQPKPMPWSRCR